MVYFISHAIPLTVLGYQIVDLTSKNIDSFYLETQKWNVTGLLGTANSSLCGSSHPILGGYGILAPVAIMTKNYTSLPAHTAIYYQITFNFIDKFKNPDYFTLTLDSTSIAGGSSLRTYNSYVTSNICGGPDADTTQFMIAGTMPHTANLLTFQLTSKAATGANSGTLGIRDIQLTFVNESSITTASSCFRVFDSQLLGLSGECSCVKGAYLKSGSCTTCNSACQNCFGPDASQCYACASGYSFTGSRCIKCDSSCLTCSGPGSLQCVTCKDGYWLQPNGSCTAACDLPVATRQAVGSLQLCYAACETNQYILWDGTCANNCSSPLVLSISGTNQFCNQPCKTGEYLYWNGSCISGCGGVLVSSSVFGVASCNKPCQSGEFLHWDNTCLLGCEPPLVSSSTSDGVLICHKPCQTVEYLYENGSCIVGCITPFKSSNLNGVDMCNQPCQTGEYFYWNDTCLPGCDIPLISSSTSDSILTCNQPCKAGEHLNWNNLCVGSCPTPLISLISSNSVALCSKPCQNNDDFFYANGSCLPTCPSPFISSNTGEVALCNEPCQNNEYLYWDGTCNPRCSSPLVPQSEFCNKPCKDFEYLYEDNSCQSKCPTPYLVSNNGEVLLCNKPCGNNEFLYWNNSCNAACPSPLVSSITNNEVVALCNKPCDDNEFLDWNNICVGSCSTPLVTSSNGEVLLCNKPCGNNEFLYWNNSCNTICPTPLVSSITNNEVVALCNKPCDDNEFLDWNNICVGSCPAPLVPSSQNDVATCAEPCQDGEYLNWDSSCIATCTSPLVSSFTNGVALCNKLCQNNDFLYSNGSCLSACPSPFLQSSLLNVNLCQSPCANPQFLHPNGSCSTKCPFPLVVSTLIDGIPRCSSPCLNPNDYYYNANNTCGKSCTFPSTTQTIEFLQVCFTPLTSSSTDQGGLTDNEIQSVDQAKATTNAAGAAASVGIAASSIISSHGSGAITLVSLIKMLDYIRYMKINYPPKLEYMMSLRNYDTITLTFNVNLPASIEKEFPIYPLPGKFGKYDLVSSFVVNYWEESFTLGVLLFVLAFSVLLASRAKDVQHIGTYSKKIRDILKWNLFLIIFCGNVDSVGVFSSLELRTTHFNSFVSVFGTLLCIFVNVLVLYLMLMIPYIVYSLRRARRKVLPLGKKFGLNDYNAKADAQRFGLCGVLFMNFKKNSVLQHSCMFFILFRVYLFNIIIGYFFEYPLTQAILIMLMSAMMLGYFSIARPFKNPFELIKTMTYEIIIAMVNICVLILAVMDHGNIENKESRVHLGDVIIFSNMLFNLMAVLFMIIELFIKIIKVYKLRKTIIAKGWRYWMNIAGFLLQPEELEMDEKEDPVIRIQAKYASKTVERLPSSPKKLKGQTLSDEQSCRDSDTPSEKISSIFKGIPSPTSVLSLNKVGILKTNSILSLDAFSDFGSKNNLLTPANARTSTIFSHTPLSPISLLQSLDNQSATQSPRMLMHFSSQISFLDLEQNKFANEDKGMLAQRNRSSEVYVNPPKFIRRKERSSTTSFLMPDNSENLPDFSFESGVLGKGANPPRHQSRFSRFSPEKSKVFPEENNPSVIVKESNFFEDLSKIEN